MVYDKSITDVDIPNLSFECVMFAKDSYEKFKQANPGKNIDFDSFLIGWIIGVVQALK